MKRAVRALYEPWLEASTRHFQELVQEAGKLGSPPILGERDACVLFVDGLRFDVGAALAAELEQRGVIAKVGCVGILRSAEQCAFLPGWRFGKQWGKNINWKMIMSSHIRS